MNGIKGGENMKKIFAVFPTIIILLFCYVVLTFPELFSTTLKRNLLNDLNNGDLQAWEFYEKTYIENDIELFEEENLK